MKKGEGKDIDQIFAEGTPIDEAIDAAVRKAVIWHKRMGNPVAEWRDGRVVWVQPEDISFEDDRGGSPGQQIGEPGRESSSGGG
jgi:hypothetical protein